VSVFGQGEPRVWIDMSNSPHPLLFEPIAREIEERGGEVAVTYRDHAQTAQLTLERWPGATLIGEASPPGRARKAAAIGGRVARLARWAWRARPQVALSHNSYAQLLAARTLWIPAVTAMDYEHQPANGVAFRSATRILLPDAVPEEIVAKQGAKPRKVTRYSGLKEEIYLAGFEPDREILARLGVRRPEGGAVVVARSAPAGAAYHPDENPILDECLRALDARGDVVTVALARHGWQREHLRGLGLGSLTVPEEAIDARSLLFAADAFVGAGGTMSREASLLGLPTWSAFAGERPAVDRWLEEQGRLHLLTDPAQLAAIGPREGAGADLARLEREGTRIRDAFVDEVYAAARVSQVRAADLRRYRETEDHG
jgi:predicted glycosyltransferase